MCIPNRYNKILNLCYYKLVMCDDQGRHSQLVKLLKMGDWVLRYIKVIDSSLDITTYPEIKDHD